MEDVRFFGRGEAQRLRFMELKRGIWRHVVLPELVCSGVVLGFVIGFLLFEPLMSTRTENRVAAIVPDEQPQKQHMTLIFTGDLMQHLPQVYAAQQQDGSMDYTACFSRLKGYFAGADFVVANLETTLGEPPYSGYPQFRSPIALAEAMRRVGIDVAVLANNHVCDRGGVGIRSTLDALDRTGVRHTGAWADTVPVDNHPLWLEKGPFRVALFNYTYGTNGIPVPRGCFVNGIDTLRMGRDIAEARQSGASHVVGLLHWGKEYEAIPDRVQRSLSEFCRRAGAEIVIGSHPHVVQALEADTDSSGRIVGVTAYSLGNFVSNQRKPGTDGGISVRIGLTLSEDMKTTEYAPEYLIHWTAITRDRKSRSGYRYEIVPAYAEETLPEELRPGLNRFVDRTRRYMSRYNSGFREITCGF